MVGLMSQPLYTPENFLCYPPICRAPQRSGCFVKENNLFLAGYPIAVPQFPSPESCPCIFWALQEMNYDNLSQGPLQGYLLWRFLSSSCSHCCFLFRRYPVWISFWRRAILTAFLFASLSVCGVMLRYYMKTDQGICIISCLVKIL